MIEIKELTFKYSGSKKNALENVSLTIEKGDFVGLIGESGAGKTTLCSCINGLIPHHYTGDFYGSVKIQGTDTFDIEPGKLALKVGSVFQDVDSQLVSFFVEDEILFGLENFGIPKDQIEQRITAALEALEIQELRHREISTLSGGQKQNRFPPTAGLFYCKIFPNKAKNLFVRRKAEEKIWTKNSTPSSHRGRSEIARSRTASF